MKGSRNLGSLLVLLLLTLSAFLGTVHLAPSADAATLTVATPTLGSAAIDADQSTTVTGSIPSSGGTAPFSWDWYVSYNSGSFNPDSTSQDVCGTGASGSGASAGQTITCNLTPPFPSPYLVEGTYAFKLYVSDGSFGDFGTSSPSSTLTVNSPIGFAFSQTTNSFSTPYISSGQDNVITFTPSGGTSPYTYAWTTPSLTVASGCTSADDTCSVTNPATGTYYVTFSATDGAGETFSPPSIPVVNPPLSAAAPTPASVTIDSGQTVTLTSHPSGGSGSYLYQWFTVTTTLCAEDSPIGGAASATYAASPTSTTEYYYVLGDPVTMFTVCSSAANVTVNPAMTAGAPTPSPASVSSGGSVTLTAHASGGTGTLSYQWYSGTSATCSSDATVLGAASATYTTTISADTYFCYSATDQATTPVTLSSATTQVTIAAPPLPPPNPSVTLTPSSVSVEQGATVTLTAAAQGDGTSYTIIWNFDGITGATCTYASAQSVCTFTPPPGTYEVSVTATGSNGQSGSAVAALTVLANYQVTLTGSSVDAIVGEPFTVSAAVAGAPTDLTYDWTFSVGNGQSGSCGQSSSTCTVTPTSVGSVKFSLEVSDKNGAGSQTLTVTVVSKLTATISVAGVTDASGAYITGSTTGFTGTTKGGASPYAYLWDFTVDASPIPGCSTAYCPITWTQPGLASVKLTVTDASGQTATATLLVTVKAPVITLTSSPSCLATGSSAPVTATVTTGAPAVAADGGYFLLSSDGLVCAYGSALSHGPYSGGASLVGIASTPDGRGYWVLDSNGGVTAFGSASYLGSPHDKGVSGETWVGIAASPDGKGYWVVSKDGSVYAFGARYYGSIGFPSPPGLGLHIYNFVGMIAPPTGGYWLVQSTGGIFAFGKASYLGSTLGEGIRVNDIVGGASTPDGKGYWILGSDGAVYGFGDAKYFGGASTGKFVGISPTSDGKGYWLLSSDGTVYTFGDAGKLGGAASFGKAFVGMSAVSGMTKAAGGATPEPVVGASVSFDVTTGPDAGESFTVTTGPDGTATITLINDGAPGTDAVAVGSSGQIASASLTFTTQSTTSGQYMITLSPASQSAVAGVAAPLTATVEDPSGNAASGFVVTLSVTSGPDAGLTVAGTTGASGTVSFSLRGANQGTDDLTAVLQTPSTPSSPAATVTSNQAVVKWAAPVTITSSANSPGKGTPSNPAPPGGTATLTVVLTEPAAGLAIFPAALDLGGPLAATTPGSATFYFAVLDGPEAATPPPSLPGVPVYFDVALSNSTPLPAGTMAKLCLTYQFFAAGTQLLYWNGSAWVSPSGVSESGDEVCGSVLTSVLGGTPFVANAFTTINTPVAGGPYGTGLLPLALPILIAVIGAVLVMLRSKRAVPDAPR